MRIFAEPRNGDSFDRVVTQAIKILHDAHIQSALAGRTVNGHAIVLIDPEAVPEALATLERAGLRSSVGESGPDNGRRPTVTWSFDSRSMLRHRSDPFTVTWRPASPRSA
jgi:hypothetical protein